jgi:hypothetical protein
MQVGKFPYYNRIGRMMYDEHGNCTHCGHTAAQHNRGCNLRGHWQPELRTHSGPCDCWMESPRQDAESAGAASMWNAYLGRTP